MCSSNCRVLLSPITVPLCAGLDAPLSQYHVDEWRLTGMDLLQLTSQDLERLGVHKIGHQELILEAVEKLCSLVREGRSWIAQKLARLRQTFPGNKVCPPGVRELPRMDDQMEIHPALLLPAPFFRISKGREKDKLFVMSQRAAFLRKHLHLLLRSFYSLFRTRRSIQPSVNFGRSL